MSTREKALCLVRWLRAKNLTGMENQEANYRNLRNCFIGHALSEDKHESLPIISSAIFCCVAERLGIRASCCAFPSHVHASVLAPAGQTLDGAYVDDPNAELDSMYLDPYGSDEEVTLEDLRSRLVEFGWTQGPEAFLKASPVPIIVQRTAQNIKASYSQIQSLSDDDPTEYGMKRLRTGHPDLNLEAAMYASMWADLMVKQATNAHWDTNLYQFLNRFALSWGEDAWIVEKYLVPLYDTFINSQAQPRQRAGWESVHDILAMLHNLNNRQPDVHRRYTEEIHSRVLYKIGQVFRHKRYNYIGIINGWTASNIQPLPTPHYLTAEEADDESYDASVDPSGVKKSPRTYYTCLYVVNVNYVLVCILAQKLTWSPAFVGALPSTVSAWRKTASKSSRIPT